MIPVFDIAKSMRGGMKCGMRGDMKCSSVRNIGNTPTITSEYWNSVNRIQKMKTLPILTPLEYVFCNPFSEDSVIHTPHSVTYDVNYNLDQKEYEKEYENPYDVIGVKTFQQ